MAFKPVKTFVVSATDSASAASSIVFGEDWLDKNDFKQMLITVDGDLSVVNFGDSTVVASDTVTAGKLPDGNMAVLGATAVLIELNGTEEFVSVMTVAATTTATIYLTLGSNWPN